MATIRTCPPRMIQTRHGWLALDLWQSAPSDRARRAAAELLEEVGGTTPPDAPLPGSPAEDQGRGAGAGGDHDTSR